MISIYSIFGIHRAWSDYFPSSSVQPVGGTNQAKMYHDGSEIYIKDAKFISFDGPAIYFFNEQQQNTKILIEDTTLYDVHRDADLGAIVANNAAYVVQSKICSKGLTTTAQWCHSIVQMSNDLTSTSIQNSVMESVSVSDYTTSQDIIIFSYAPTTKFNKINISGCTTQNTCGYLVSGNNKCEVTRALIIRNSASSNTASVCTYGYDLNIEVMTQFCNFIHNTASNCFEVQLVPRNLKFQNCILFGTHSYLLYFSNNMGSPYATFIDCQVFSKSHKVQSSRTTPRTDFQGGSVISSVENPGLPKNCYENPDEHHDPIPERTQYVPTPEQTQYRPTPERTQYVPTPKQTQYVPTPERSPYVPTHFSQRTQTQKHNHPQPTTPRATWNGLYADPPNQIIRGPDIPEIQEKQPPLQTKYAKTDVQTIAKVVHITAGTIIIISVFILTAINLARSFSKVKHAVTSKTEASSNIEEFTSSLDYYTVSDSLSSSSLETNNNPFLTE